MSRPTLPQLPLDRPHGYPRPGAPREGGPTYYGVIVKTTDGRTPFAVQLISTGDDDQTARRGLSEWLWRSPLRARQHPMVLLTPDAVIGVLNAAIRGDMSVIATDALANRLSAMLSSFTGLDPRERAELARKADARADHAAQVLNDHGGLLP